MPNFPGTQCCAAQTRKHLTLRLRQTLVAGFRDQHGLTQRKTTGGDVLRRSGSSVHAFRSLVFRVAADLGVLSLAARIAEPAQR